MLSPAFHTNAWFSLIAVFEIHNNLKSCVSSSWSFSVVGSFIVENFENALQLFRKLRASNFAPKINEMLLVNVSFFFLIQHSFLSYRFFIVIPNL